MSMHEDAGHRIESQGSFLSSRSGLVLRLPASCSSPSTGPTCLVRFCTCRYSFAP
jgi:hypothetical protein